MQLNKVFVKENPQSILVYGPAKSGKTQLVAGLVKRGYKLLWLDLEHGVQTLQQCLTPEEQQSVTYIGVQDTNITPLAIETVGMLFASNKKHKVCTVHGRINCAACSKLTGVDDHTVVNLHELDSSWVVVVDSLTQLSDSALAHATKDIQENILRSSGKADWDAYGYQGLLLTNVLSNMQQAKFHRVFISHEDVIEQADKTELIFPVCGTRAFSRRVARYFDHICYLYRQNKQHKAASSTAFKASVMAGSRTDISLEDGADLANLLRMERPTPAAPAATPRAMQAGARNLLSKLPGRAAAAPAAQTEPPAATAAQPNSQPAADAM